MAYRGLTSIFWGLVGFGFLSLPGLRCLHHPDQDRDLPSRLPSFFSQRHQGLFFDNFQITAHGEE